MLSSKNRDRPGWLLRRIFLWGLLLAFTVMLGLVFLGLPADRFLGAERAAQKPLSTIAIYGGLPLLRPETDGLEAYIAGSETTHPLIVRWKKSYEFTELISIKDIENSDTDYLILAQIGALTPDELVLLDGWIRSGGRVLIFADPDLVWESIFALGDPRRPSGTSLLTPLLQHWGLAFAIDVDQTNDPRAINWGARRLIVERSGFFSLMAKASGACALAADNVLADCKIGHGRAVIIADADVLHPDYFPQLTIAERWGLMQPPGNWDAASQFMTMLIR